MPLWSACFDPKKSRIASPRSFASTSCAVFKFWGYGLTSSPNDSHKEAFEEGWDTLSEPQRTPQNWGYPKVPPQKKSVGHAEFRKSWGIICAEILKSNLSIRHSNLSTTCLNQVQETELICGRWTYNIPSNIKLIHLSGLSLSFICRSKTDKTCGYPTCHERWWSTPKPPLVAWLVRTGWIIVWMLYRYHGILYEI